MTTEALKSVPVTNLDATPVVPNTTGEGAPGFLREVNGHVASTTGVTSPSTYRLVRIPTNAKVKRVWLKNAALGGATAADVDVAFSDTNDGTQPALQGGVVQITGPVDNKLFGAATSLVAATAEYTDITFANTYTTDHQNLPLWQVLVNLGATQFSGDPGGFFDIVVKTTATVTAGGDISVEVDYVE